LLLLVVVVGCRCWLLPIANQAPHKTEDLPRRLLKRDPASKGLLDSMSDHAAQLCKEGEKPEYPEKDLQSTELASSAGIAFSPWSRLCT
jgi:hypothetical protein